MQENDLGEYGKEIVMNMSNSSMFQRYIGDVLSKVFLIHSGIEETIIGIKLFFENKLNLIILNQGDEINVFDSLSSQYEKEENINYVDVFV